MTHLPLYVLVEPLVVGREVLDLGPDGEGPTLLRRAGASRVVCTQDVLRLAALPDRSVDVVICVEGLDGITGLDRRSLLDQVARLLRPDGFAMVAARNAELGPAGGIDYEELASLLRERFAAVALLAQSPMTGVYISYLHPAHLADDLCLNTDLVAEPEEASHFVAFFSASAVPELHPYQLVTLPYHRLMASTLDARRKLEDQSQSLRDQIARLGEQVGQRESDLLRLAGRTARLERLEGELEGARETEAELARARAEIGQLAEEVARQRQAGAGWMQELQDARQACEDLSRRAEQAERAATELALQRDQLAARHEGLLQGQRELATEFARLKEALQAAQVDGTARQREAASLTVALDESRREAMQLREDGARARERYAALIQERDRLREALIALEESGRQLGDERQHLDARRADLEQQVAQLQGAAAGAQAEMLQLRGRLAELESAREALSAAQAQLLIERAEREAAGRQAEEQRAHADELETRSVELSVRAEARHRELQ